MTAIYRRASADAESEKSWMYRRQTGSNDAIEPIELSRITPA